MRHAYDEITLLVDITNSVRNWISTILVVVSLESSVITILIVILQ